MKRKLLNLLKVFIGLLILIFIVYFLFTCSTV